jgi:hypothetical protein
VDVVAEVKERDRRYARQLPDGFITMSGMPIDRLTMLVGRHSASQTAPARAELAHALMLVLQPLLDPGAEVAEQKRQTCEDIVASWLTRQ